MADPTAPERTPGSAVRRPRALERLVVVGVVAAVLVAVAAWIAMNRTDGTAEAASASAAASGSGSFSESSGAPADGADAGGAAPADQATSGDPAAGSTDGSVPGSASPSDGAGAGASSGTGGSGAARSTASGGSSGSAPLSPTTAFLTQLAASGLGPPVDDTQKLAMADDVCQELKNGSKYADVVRALTFAGASDEQAANFATLAITNLCPKFPIG